jgi:hypothetical protein
MQSAGRDILSQVAYFVAGSLTVLNFSAAYPQPLKWKYRLKNRDLLRTNSQVRLGSVMAYGVHSQNAVPSPGC